MYLTSWLCSWGYYILEISGPLNVAIIAAKDVTLLSLLLLEYKTETKGGRCCEASRWDEKKRQPQTKWMGYKEIRFSSNLSSNQRPHVAWVSFASRHFNPSIAAAFRCGQTGCHFEYVYLFTRSAGTWRQLVQIDSPVQLSLGTEKERTVKNRHGGCIHSAYFSASPEVVQPCKIFLLLAKRQKKKTMAGLILNFWDLYWFKHLINADLKAIVLHKHYRISSGCLLTLNSCFWGG